MELAKRATAIRHIAEEGILYDEILRKKQQNAWKSWTLFTGGGLAILLSILASMYLTHDAIRTTLINTYARSEKTQDVITSSFFSLSSLGLIPQPIDQPFLPESIALKTLELQEAYRRTDTTLANTTSLQVELQQLEILLANTQQMLSTAEHALRLSAQHFAVHSIHSILPPILTAALANTSRIQKERCRIPLGRDVCMRIEAEYERVSNTSKHLQTQSAHLNTTEGTFEVLYERGSLQAYSQLTMNRKWVENWYHQNLTNEIPYDSISIPYLESIHSFISRAMNANIVGTELDTPMGREAHAYMVAQLFYRYLNLIKTLVSMNADGKRLILESYQHIHDREARDSQYTRAKMRVESDQSNCVEKTTLLCSILETNRQSVITWINNIERFQLPLPANFIQDAYQALLTSEITTIITIRDFRRFQRINEFKKNPSVAFLILSAAIGLAVFIVAKLLFFDLPYTYIRLLILPAEYMTERIQYSIDTLREKRIQQVLETGSHSLHLLDAVSSAENIRTSPKADVALLNRNVGAAKSERKSIRNQNSSERRLQDINRGTQGDSN